MSVRYCFMMGSTSVSERTARAYAESLQLAANPDLRDLLTEIFVSEKASDEQIKAIPVLTGRLSEREQTAIETTMARVEALANSEELHKFLSAGLSDRIHHFQQWNARGAANERATKVGIAVSVVASVIGVLAGLSTGHPDLAAEAPLAGAFAATLATTYGYSRAGVIDGEINAYGVFD